MWPKFNLKAGGRAAIPPRALQHMLAASATLSQSQRQVAFKDMIYPPIPSGLYCMDGPEEGHFGGKASLRLLPRFHIGCLEQESNHSITLSSAPTQGHG